MRIWSLVFLRSADPTSSFSGFRDSGLGFRV